MKEFLDLLYFALLIALLPAATFGMCVHARILYLLKSRHEEIWKSLGRPTLFVKNTLNNNLNVQKFLSKKKYLDIDDQALVTLCEFQRGYIRFYMLGFHVWLVLFVYQYLIVVVL